MVVDHWRLTADGGLEFTGQGFLQNEDGDYITEDNTIVPAEEFDPDNPGNVVGAKGIETGLLNILNDGGTSGRGYDGFTDAQKINAQNLMRSAGLNSYLRGEDPIEDRYWDRNIPLFQKISADNLAMAGFDDLYKQLDSRIEPITTTRIDPVVNDLSEQTVNQVIESRARELGISTQALEAVVEKESSGRAFASDGRMIIRFEAHVFDRETDGEFSEFFTYDTEGTDGKDPRPWTLQGYRKSVNDTFDPFHDRYQEGEWDAFKFAQSLDAEAAASSISMGMGQVMGFNHRLLGFNSAREMFDSFSRSAANQVDGMVNFMQSTGAHQYLRGFPTTSDFQEFGRIYNGTGQPATYGSQVQQLFSNRIDYSFLSGLYRY